MDKRYLHSSFHFHAMRELVSSEIISPNFSGMPKRESYFQFFLSEEGAQKANDFLMESTILNYRQDNK